MHNVQLTHQLKEHEHDAEKRREQRPDPRGAPERTEGVCLVAQYGGSRGLKVCVKGLGMVARVN